jgi:hypothetical protein
VATLASSRGWFSWWQLVAMLSIFVKILSFLLAVANMTAALDIKRLAKPSTGVDVSAYP